MGAVGATRNGCVGVWSVVAGRDERGERGEVGALVLGVRAVADGRLVGEVARARAQKTVVDSVLTTWSWARTREGVGSGVFFYSVALGLSLIHI